MSVQFGAAVLLTNLDQVSTSEPGLQPTHIRTFHPRRGRIGPTRAQAMVELWPIQGFDIDPHGPALDPAALFGHSSDEAARPLVLEIGCGMGEATVEQAATDPARDYLAVDVHTPGLGNLLSMARDRGLGNVRAAQGDAIDLLRDLVKPASVDTIQVFFPDPWPKAKHHKRRIIQPENVTLMRERLRSGGVLHCATDWADYAEQMLDVLSADSGLANTAGTVDGYTPRPEWRPVTKFERRALEAGREIFDLVFTAR